MKKSYILFIILTISVSTSKVWAVDPGLGSNGAPLQSGSLTQAMVFTIEGDFKAAGIGMRNLGYGDITITGIPTGAMIEKAFLYWVILDSNEMLDFKNGNFNGISITGGLIGEGPDPCWPFSSHHYAYRADVTCLVIGNGIYKLTDFTSGLTDGTDPWPSEPVLPLAEGATLLVV